MSAKRGIYVAPFDELVEPGLLAELAQLAETHAWDGFFVWDHIRYQPPVRAVADPAPDAAGSFDIVVDPPAREDPGPWEAAGATWILSDFGSQPREAEVRGVIERGPR